MQNDQLSLNTLVSERHTGIQQCLTLFTLGILLQLSLGSPVSEACIMLGSLGSSASTLQIVLFKTVFIASTVPTKS